MNLIRHYKGIVLYLLFNGKYRLTYTDNYGYLVEYDYDFYTVALTRYLKRVAKIQAKRQLTLKLEC